MTPKFDPGCTGKKAYQSYEDANKARISQGKPLRIYTCEHCGMRHLTSQIEKPKKFWKHG